MASGPCCACRWPSSRWPTSLPRAGSPLCPDRLARRHVRGQPKLAPPNPYVPRPPPTPRPLLRAEVLADGLRTPPSPGLAPAACCLRPCGLPLIYCANTAAISSRTGGDDGSSPETRTRGLLGWWPPRQGQGGWRPGVRRGPHSLWRGACQLPDEVLLCSWEF